MFIKQSSRPRRRPSKWVGWGVGFATVVGIFALGYFLGYRKNLENARIQVASGLETVTYSSAQESHSVTGTVKSKDQDSFVISFIAVTSGLADASEAKPQDVEILVDKDTKFYWSRFDGDGAVKQRFPGSLDDVKPSGNVVILSADNVIGASSVHASSVEILNAPN